MATLAIARHAVSRIVVSCLVGSLSWLAAVTPAWGQERRLPHLITAFDLSASLDDRDAQDVVNSFASRYLSRSGLEDKVRRWDVVAFANCADVLVTRKDPLALRKAGDVNPLRALEHVD